MVRLVNSLICFSNHFSRGLQMRVVRTDIEESVKKTNKQTSKQTMTIKTN